MLQVLIEMGPWSADRVAFSMYQRIEKQKIKTPHERHYILLCLVNTALLEVHAICEQNFRKFKNNHKECVEKHSSPKVLRLLEVLRLFKPDDTSSKNDTIKRISSELDQMDFQKLSRILETKCHSVEQAVEKQQLESRSIVENLDSIIKPEFQAKLNAENAQQNIGESENKTLNNKLKKTEDIKTTSSNTHGHHHSGTHHNRPKRRPFRRHNRDHNDGADTLCSIIFCNTNYTARVLFELLAEMSRHDPDLKFIKCQFTTDRVADPITEPKEAESEHRRQEEVLKRFRMHDCNVLIGTSVLEEGIDVPKCNLVVRWDPPTTYRSYVQCKGRARAVPAYHVVLVASETDILKTTNEQLSDKSHRLLCTLSEDQDKCLTDSEKSDKEEDGEENKINGISTKQKFVYGSSKGTIKILNPEVITNKHPSKQTTKGSDIVLKEIEDVPLAIKDANEIVETNVEENNKVAELNSSREKESTSNCGNDSIGAMSSSDDNDLENSVIKSNDDYKVYDLNSIAEKDQTSRKTANNKKINATEEIMERSCENYKVFDLNKIMDEVSNIKETNVVENEDHGNETSPKKDSDLKNDTVTEKEAKYFQCLLEDKVVEPEEKVLSNEEESIKFCKMIKTTDDIVKQMAEYREIEKVI